MKLRSVTFIDSTFRNCYFDDVTSVGSSFRNCTFIDAFFFNTGETLQLKSLSLGLKYNISDSQIPQMTEKCLTDKKVYWLVINSFLFHCRHRWIQADRRHRGGQQHVHPQQEGVSDDIRWRLQRLLGLLHQLPRDPGCSARQHCVRPSHGQNWPSVHVR